MNDLWAYSLEAQQWWLPETTGTPPCPRRGHFMAIVGGKLYVGYGAVAEGNHQADMTVLDLATWHWNAVPAQVGHPHASQPALTHLNLPLTGKRGSSGVDFLSASRGFSQGMVPSPRRQAAVEILQNRWIIVHGGFLGGGFATDTLAFDTKMHVWSQLEVRPGTAKLRIGWERPARRHCERR